MALKSKINKAAYDGLNDILKAEYKADGDNYVLDTDDGNELRTALTNAKKERETARDEIKTLKTELDTVKAAGGDFSKLEKDYKEKIAKLEADVTTANAATTKVREDSTLGAKAAAIAAKNFKAPSLITDKIRARMDLDPRDNTTIRWKDKDGKVSVLTEADVLKEFLDNAEYKDIVIVNRASGGAGQGTTPGGAGNPPIIPTMPDGKPLPLTAMTPAQLTAHMAAKKAAAAEGAQT